ncbi:MAG: D-2-hydroxyacid dehydrogenase, partial [Bacillota bacterium]
MKIVVLDGHTLNPGDIFWQGFEALGETMVFDRTADPDIAGRITGAEAVLTNKTPLSRETILGTPSLRYIGVLATGYNVVDVRAAMERGIPVCNIPSYGTAAVAQFTFALLLEICHHIGYHSESVHRGDWANSRDFCYWDYPLIELAGKTMGILGFGRIGQSVAVIAKAFGMRVIAFDSYPTKQGQALADYVPLNILYQESDVISLHCPLFAETQGIINRESIAMMKNGVILINTSRGPLIVEDDLRNALNSGRVGYAATDVVSSEPIREDNPLLQAENCLITPHIAWASKESRSRLMAIAMNNLAEFIKGNCQNNVWK